MTPVMLAMLLNLFLWDWLMEAMGRRGWLDSAWP